MNECFPLVILEAMEYKLPVISTNEGGIPDIVKDGENGLICENRIHIRWLIVLRSCWMMRN